MLKVIHKNGTTASEHADEECARRQVIGAYGANVIIDEDDRPSGRLRVWLHESDRTDDFASPVAKIELEPEPEPEEDPTVEPKPVRHHKKKEPA